MPRVPVRLRCGCPGRGPEAESSVLKLSSQSATRPQEDPKLAATRLAGASRRCVVVCPLHSIKQALPLVPRFPARALGSVMARQRSNVTDRRYSSQLQIELQVGSPI
jgi:hypothetical protein